MLKSEMWKQRHGHFRGTTWPATPNQMPHTVPDELSQESILHRRESLNPTSHCPQVGTEPCFAQTGAVEADLRPIERGPWFENAISSRLLDSEISKNDPFRIICILHGMGETTLTETVQFESEQHPTAPVPTCESSNVSAGAHRMRIHAGRLTSNVNLKQKSLTVRKASMQCIQRFGLSRQLQKFLMHDDSHSENPSAILSPTLHPSMCQTNHWRSLSNAFLAPLVGGAMPRWMQPATCDGSFLSF